ncbi:sigma 54-interacting transcriptional regulator [Colwelliaceae bacterium 6471]
MRLEIKSTDRIGITQEILAIFSNHSWSLRAIEVIPYFTYVRIEDVSVLGDDIASLLRNIDGVIYCKAIDLLPSERRENHLQTLLDRIPDPIIDIDERGTVLAVNKATLGLLDENDREIEGQPIITFIDQPLSVVLTDRAATCTLAFKGNTYIADITPVSSIGNIVGTVLTLRTMNTLGRQIALMQPRKEQGIESIIGQSEKMKLLIEQTIRYAELELPVLVTGETGTGKELIARAIHNASSRSKAPFLAINCAALPEHLLESELFGYASGAFTGAQKGGKPGLFELANGGTLFLDEVAEMSVYLQAKLLRFLQDFRYRRVGGTTELSVNVRIISATHQDLAKLIQKQLFREDLFYRLNVLSLDLPPLRERQSDIPLLAKYFINNAAKQVNQGIPVMSDDALLTLKSYNWPGNIRQLQNILFRVVALNNKAVIEQSDLSTVLSQINDTMEPFNDESGYGSVKDWATAQAMFERKLLQELYPFYPTTRKLAKRLNVSHNKIAMKLRVHGLEHNK